MRALSRRLVLLSSLLLTVSGCAARRAAPDIDRDGSSPAPVLERVAENVWIHKSWARVEPWGLVLSQGLAVKGPEGVVLVDTAWTDAETEQLLRLVERTLGAPVVAVVATHAHADKMGGMAAANRMVGKTLALASTNADAPSRGLAPALGEIGTDATLGTLELFHPGPGHSRDNLVAYHSESKTLFGGCLIRPGGSTDLGNTADADLERWASSVEAVAARFPDAALVVPSHGPAGGRELLDLTIALARAAQSR